MKVLHVLLFGSAAVAAYIPARSCSESGAEDQAIPTSGLSGQWSRPGSWGHSHHHRPTLTGSGSGTPSIRPTGPSATGFWNTTVPTGSVAASGVAASSVGPLSSCVRGTVTITVAAASSGAAPPTTALLSSATAVSSPSAVSSPPALSSPFALPSPSTVSLGATSGASVSAAVSSAASISTTAAASTSALPASTAVASYPSTYTGHISAQYQSDALSIVNTLATTYSNQTLYWSELWGYQAATIYQDLADYDFWTASETLQSYSNNLVDMVNSENLLNGAGVTDDYNDDREWWTLAFLHAYRRYGQPALLNQAVEIFDQIVASSQLSTSNQGTTPDLDDVERTVQIPGTCDVDGAVYWRQTDNSTINAVSTGLVGHIGALLYSITGNVQYRQQADLAINYERRQFLDNSTGIMVVDSLTVGTCQKNGGNLCYNTGTAHPAPNPVPVSVY